MEIGNELDVFDLDERDFQFLKTRLNEQIKQSIGLIVNTSRTNWLHTVQPVPRYPALQINALLRAQALVFSRISSKHKPACSVRSPHNPHRQRSTVSEQSLDLRQFLPLDQDARRVTPRQQ